MVIRENEKQEDNVKEEIGKQTNRKTEKKHEQTRKTAIKKKNSTGLLQLVQKEKRQYMEKKRVREGEGGEEEKNEEKEEKGRDSSGRSIS